MAPRAVGLQVEVVGCPTVCTHCWAQGVPYNAMPLQDIAWVLEQANRFRAATGLPVDAFPMHEVAAHPQASTVVRLFQDFSNAGDGHDDGRSAADNGRPYHKLVAHPLTLSSCRVPTSGIHLKGRERAGNAHDTAAGDHAAAIGHGAACD
jgi:hypothetical protein